MERVPLESRAVTSAGYDDETKELEVEFRNGRVYRYEGVPRSVYDWLLETPGKGAYVSRMVVDKYPYRDVTPTPDLPDVAEALRASLASPAAVQEERYEEQEGKHGRDR